MYLWTKSTFALIDRLLFRRSDWDTLGDKQIRHNIPSKPYLINAGETQPSLFLSPKAHENFYGSKGSRLPFKCFSSSTPRPSPQVGISIPPPGTRPSSILSHLENHPGLIRSRLVSKSDTLSLQQKGHGADSRLSSLTAVPQTPEMVGFDNAGEAFSAPSMLT